MCISLFLMTHKGYQVLKNLISEGYHKSIDLVVVGIDKSVVNDYSDDIITLCISNGVNYVDSNKKEYTIESPYAIAISWRWIIKENNFKLIVLHDSLLPKYRGFAPLVNSLLNKEERIGVTALFASEEYDKGNIILQDEIHITYPIKINKAIEKVSKIYVSLVCNLFKKLTKNIELTSCLQNEDEASYSLWRDEEDYFIDWKQSASFIKRFVDAVGFPYKGAKCYLNDRIIIINEVTLINDIKIENRVAGKVVFMDDKKPVIVCAEGLIRIDQAIYEVSNETILPLQKFRVRFK